MVEFRPDVDLNPNDLRLRGTAPDRWELVFTGLPTRGLDDFGEGDLTGHATAWLPPGGFRPTRTPVDPSGLPTVARNRYRIVIDRGVIVCLQTLVFVLAFFLAPKHGRLAARGGEG